MPETNYVSAINVHICRSVVSARHMRTRLNSAVTCNDFLSFERWSNMASESTSADIEESVFQVLECVVNYADPTTSSNAMNAFVGSKERVRIPSSGKYCSLQALVKHVVEHAGIRKEAQKRGLGSSIDIIDNRKLDLHNGSYLRCPDLDY